MSIAGNAAAGRKGKRGPSSPTHSIHSPTATASPLPKVKITVRPTTPASRSTSSRPSSSTLPRPRAAASNQRHEILSDNSELTPAEDEDEDDDDLTEDDDDITFSHVAPRKRKSKEAGPHPHVTSVAVKDVKGKGKAAVHSPASVKKSTGTTGLVSEGAGSSTPKTSAVGPNGRERKRVLKLGEVARRRARDDKFGFGGDRFGGITPTQSRFSNPMIDSDSTSSYGDDESERENTLSLHPDDSDAESTSGLPAAFAGLPAAFVGQEIEDLAYGAGHVDSGMEEEAEHEWWQQEQDDDDEDFIAQLTGSDIEGLQSQSSVHASDSDDPMTDSDMTSDSDGAMDEFGFPLPFGAEAEHTSDAPLILMENWDGQFVLVQPRNDRSRSRHRGDRGSRTAGSIGESTSLSAGEQALVIDADADDDSDSSSEWSGLDEDDDGGDTTDSMAEEDMPVLDSPALDELIGQQLAAGFGLVSALPTPSIMDESNVPFAIADMVIETPPLSTTSSLSTAAATTPATAGPAAPATPLTAPVAPMMGTFIVADDPCAHAVIDGSKTTTKSPFTRRRRAGGKGDTASVASSSRGDDRKRKSRLGAGLQQDPFSPGLIKKIRYSSIPGHPRFIAARRAAQTLIDPLDRETTPSEEEETAFSLEDMLDASVLRMNDLEAAAATAVAQTTPQQHDSLRHLFRFDKVPVSMYMRRNFHSSTSKRDNSSDMTPSHGHGHGGHHASHYHSFSSPVGRGGSRATLADTLAGPLGHPSTRMLISPILAPVLSGASDGGYDEDAAALSRKERRKARKRLGHEIGLLEI